MKGKLFILVVFIVIALIFCTTSGFAYYSFLSPESNIALENLREKHRIKEIVLEKEEGIVWSVIIPKNSGMEVKEVVQEAVYSEEGRFEGLYRFTDIIIINPEGWTRIVWGSAIKFHPYDIPRLHFIFNS